jgi:hypothetical protein
MRKNGGDSLSNLFFFTLTSIDFSKLEASLHSYPHWNMDVELLYPVIVHGYCILQQGFIDPPSLG